MPTWFLQFELLIGWTVGYINKLSDKPFEGAENLKTEKKVNIFENITIAEDLSVICNRVFLIYLELFSILTGALHFYYHAISFS